MVVQFIAALAAAYFLFDYLTTREERLTQEAKTESETFDPSDPTLLEVGLATGGGISDAASTVYDDATGAIGTVYDDVGDAVSDVGGAVSDGASFVGGAISDAGDFVQDTGSAVVGGVSSALGGLIDAVSSPFRQTSQSQDLDTSTDQTYSQADTETIAAEEEVAAVLREQLGGAPIPGDYTGGF